MGHPITQEDLDLISTININNCLKFLKNCFFYILIPFIFYYVFNLNK